MDVWGKILFMLVAAAVAAAHMDPPLSPTVLTASEGGEVPFWSRLNNNTHAILSVNNKTLLNFDNGLILGKDDMIRVEDWTRIVMTNVQMNDRNIYKLRIYERPSPEEKLYHFKLHVTEAPPRASDVTSAPPAANQGPDPGSDSDPGPDPGSNKTLLAVGLAISCLMIVIFSALAFWKWKWIKEKLQKKQNQNQNGQQDVAQYTAVNPDEAHVELREVRAG